MAEPRVVIGNMTKDQLKAQAPYTYPDTKYRGTVFSDTGVRQGDRTAMGAADHSKMATASTGDFNADGQMSANAIIGASVKNAGDHTVGTVEDVLSE